MFLTHVRPLSQVHAWNCRNFDKDNIDAGIMKKIQTYTPLPDFQPEKIEKVSKGRKLVVVYCGVCSAAGVGALMVFSSSYHVRC